MRAGGYAVGTLLALGASPLMIRHLGVQEFGRYVTVMSLVTLIAGITEGGMGTIALREYASRAGTDRDVVMRDLLGIRIALTLAGIALGIGFAIVAGYDSVLVVGTLVAGFALLLQSLQLLLGAALQGELRFGWITLTDVLRQALFVAAIVILIVADAKLGAFFLAQLPAFALTLVLTGWLVRRIMPLRPSFHPGRWWPLLGATITYAIAVALNAAYFRIAVLGLSVSADELETGYFATAYRVLEVLIALPALIIGAAFPILTRAARDDHDRLDYIATRLTELALVVGAWLALGVFLAAEPIIRVLAGYDSDPSIGLLRIQSAALVATFVIVANGYILLSLHRHRTILVANILALVGRAGPLRRADRLYEATGAAVAVLATEFVLAAAVLVPVLRERPAVLVSLRRAPAIIAACVVAGLIGLVPGLPALVAAVAAMLVFPALLVAVRGFPPEATELLKGLRAR